MSPLGDNYRKALERRLRRTDPDLRTALLHHARGEHDMCRYFLDRFLELEPHPRGGDGPINAEGIAELITERRFGSR